MEDGEDRGERADPEEWGSLAEPVRDDGLVTGESVWRGTAQEDRY